jgi:hypothetical protein
MQKITAFNLQAYNSGVFQIFDASLGNEDAYAVCNLLFTQGFSCRPGSYNLTTFTRCFNLKMEIWLADKLEEITLRDDSLRAILLPFWVPAAGLKIDDDDPQEQHRFVIPEGEYAMLYELKLRDDQEYLESEEYQKDVDAGMTEESCFLTFYPRKKPVQPEILRLETRSSFPSWVKECAILNPTYPLSMEDVSSLFNYKHE